jgi:predicted nucleotidyltransferase
MRDRYGARLYLFGSRARGTAHADSDYDLVAVAVPFSVQRRISRALDRSQLWEAAGGWGRSLDLHCLTPSEFQAETRDGFGYLGQAKERGELIRIRCAPRSSRRRPAGDVLAQDSLSVSRQAS